MLGPRQKPDDGMEFRCGDFQELGSEREGQAGRMALMSRPQGGHSRFLSRAVTTVCHLFKTRRLESFPRSHWALDVEEYLHSSASPKAREALL